MAGNHGGRRPGAGRKFGSKDGFRRKIVGGKSFLEHRTQQVLQFLKTNDAEIFDGDSVALMISVYKNEKLPLSVRLQCAMAAAPFERPRLNATDARLLVQQVGVTEREDADATAWLVDQLDRLAMAEEQHETHASEIVPPAPAPVVVRKRESVEIDAIAVQHDCDMVAESGRKPSVSEQLADTSQAPSEPVASNSHRDGSGAKSPTSAPAGERNGAAASDIVPGGEGHSAATPVDGQTDLEEFVAGVDRLGRPVLKYLPRQRGTGFD